MGAIALEIMVFIRKYFFRFEDAQMCHMVHLNGKIIQYVIGFWIRKCGESLTYWNFVGLGGF
jgi:hypothetical protein